MLSIFRFGTYAFSLAHFCEALAALSICFPVKVTTALYSVSFFIQLLALFSLVRGHYNTSKKPCQPLQIQGFLRFVKKFSIVSIQSIFIVSVFSGMLDFGKNIFKKFFNFLKSSIIDHLRECSKKGKSGAIFGTILPCVAFKNLRRVFARLSIHSP